MSFTRISKIFRFIVLTLSYFSAPAAFAETSLPIDGSRLALYAFNEGTGSVVHDISGVGDALDLHIKDPANTSWLPNGGLVVNKETLIASSVPANKLIAGIKATNAISIEAWVTPESTAANGPARLASLSADAYERNFTLGQQYAAYEVRLRNSETNLNGTPSLPSPEGTLTTSLTHIVYTRSADGIARLYINGVKQSETATTGSFSNWDDSYKFALANELTSSRAWLGTFFQIAVYNRALDVGSIDSKFAAGPKSTQIPDAPASAKTTTATTTGDTTVTPIDSSISGDTSTVDSAVYGVTTLNWMTPTTRTDGTTLLTSDIAGYRLYYGKSAGDYTSSLTINGAYTTSATVTNLPAGTWYFSVTARDRDGRESAYSSSIAKVVN